MNSSRAWLALLLSFQLASPALAMVPPSVSAQVSPRTSITGLGTPTGDGLGLDLFVRQTTRDRLFDGRDEVDNPGGERTETLQVTFQADYRLTNRLTGILSVPTVKSKARFRDVSTGETFEQDTEGLGDVALLGKLSVFRNRIVDPTTELFAIFGLEFPTGSTDESDTAGNELPRTQQPGTGEIDYIIGAAGVRVFPAVTAYGDLSYKVNGKSNYRLGNFFAMNLGMNHTLTRFRKLSLTGEINTEVAAHDTSKEGGPMVDGETVMNTGYTCIYATPGIQFRPTRALAISASVQVPVYQNVRGVQLASDLIYNFFVTTRFGDRKPAS